MTDDKNGGGTSGAAGDSPMYLGPYEAWNFGIGRKYALPIMRRHWRFISALAEIGVERRRDHLKEIESNGWLPTLWGNPETLTFIPFVADNPTGTISQLETLGSLLFNAFVGVMHPYWHPAAPAELSPTSQPAEILLDRVKNSRFRIAFPVTDAAMHEELKPHPHDPIWHPDPGLRDRIGKDKRITVMAVIDDGLPFAHRNFRDAAGKRSRVEFCWLQSAEIDRDQKSVLFGREYTRDQIDALIEQHGNDEDTLYREAGATADTEGLGSMIDRHATHGAHVMDLAAGYAPERGQEPAEEIRIIAVQLPNTIAWDTSGFGKDMYMLSAFHYILHRADIIARKETGYGIENLRLVINFSYGFSGGRHDGGTELEAAVNELVEKRRDKNCPTALVLPAGNTFLERLHGVIGRHDFVNDTAQFHWRIQPNDRTPSYLELWFWQGFNPHGYSIELRDPWGRPRSSFSIEIEDTLNRGNGDPFKQEEIQNDSEEQIGQISVDMHRYDAKIARVADDRHPSDPADSGRYRVLIVLAPTEPEDARLPRAESGNWTVVIKRGLQASFIEDPIHCWIQRSADPISLRSGSRQSYFDDRKNQRYDLNGDLREQDSDGAFVKRFGSLNGLATGCTSLVVGGYRLGAGLGSGLASARPSRYSSAGIADEESSKQVSCSSMSDRSRVLLGTVAAGVRSGSLSFVQGTSSAAPFVARQLAETFVTAEESTVQQARNGNYLSLLCGYAPKADEQPSAPGSEELSSKKRPGPIKTRLGAVLVPPHWQPGIDRLSCDEDAATETAE